MTIRARTKQRVPWRLLLGDGSRSDDAASADGTTNMALDGALLASVREGAPPALRLYRWNPPTLSFGRNQPARGLYDEDRAREAGIAFVRRPTGGQAVLHADELTYAVIAPVPIIGRPREAYRRINAALVAGLQELAVNATVAGALAPVRRGVGPDWKAACFRDPAEGEIVVQGRKLVGSAQRCDKRVILQHGSILLSGSQAPAEALLLDPGDAGSAAVGSGWTTLEDELGHRPDRRALVDALVRAFERAVGTSLAPGRYSAEEITRADMLRAEYASREWTWRR